MIFFVDASALLKVYHEEPGTDTMRALATHGAGAFHISDHTVLELIVRLHRLRRTAPHRRKRREFDRVIARFASDRRNYLNVAVVEPAIIALAMKLASTFADSGAGTLDLIHLSSALHIQSTLPDERMVFVVSDRKLRHVVRRAGMAVFDPETQPLSELGPHPML